MRRLSLPPSLPESEATTLSSSSGPTTEENPTTTPIPNSMMTLERSNEDPIISDYVSDEETNTSNTTSIHQQVQVNVNHHHTDHTTTPPSHIDSTSNTTTDNNTSHVQQQPNSNPNTSHDSDSMWSCNICFDTANEPVITQCGHLYCWSCLYRWMQSHSTQNLQCPVCKAGIQQDKIIPIYGRGSSSNTRSDSNENQTFQNSDGVPSRPRAQYTDSRTTPNPNYNPFHNMGNIFGGGNFFGMGGGLGFGSPIGGGIHASSGTTGSSFLFADAFRFFPFFDIQYSSSSGTTSTGGGASLGMAQQQVVFIHLLLNKKNFKALFDDWHSFLDFYYSFTLYL
ncbi:hypothetical protein C9374_006744 [Naegleria lovaniensis]|uniref:RING-type E3 ubiquitin transferase n=1 Tax=Naegleria lovaniensis TaxID=51637 RepID=A0AA88GHP0_NAELO|nr:uncharacterized protein C9374_006744 [Naegleria lovaniensis]KAG2379627.1 hypothetical protein C9374_006744 [Naegleria lovaniensis]